MCVYRCPSLPPLRGVIHTCHSVPSPLEQIEYIEPLPSPSLHQKSYGTTSHPFLHYPFFSLFFFFLAAPHLYFPSLCSSVGLSGTSSTAKPSSSVKMYRAGTPALLCLVGGIHTHKCAHTHTHPGRSNCAQIQRFTLTHKHTHANTNSDSYAYDLSHTLYTIRIINSRAAEHQSHVFALWHGERYDTNQQHSYTHSHTW